MRGGGRGEGLATRRRILAAAGLVLVGGFLALFTAESLARTRQGFSPLFIYGVLLLGAILSIVVLFVLGRNVVKLYLERARGAPGSRFRTKVIALVAGMTLLPAVLLFVIATGLIQTAVQRWFDPDVGRVFADGKRLLEEYQERLEESGRRMAHHLAEEAASRDLLERSARRRLDSLVANKRREYGIAAIRVHGAQGAVLAENYDPGREAGLRGLALSGRGLEEVLAGRRDVLRHVPETAGEVVLFVGVPVRVRNRTIGAVVVGQGLGSEASTVLANLSRNYESYRQAEENEPWIRQGFVLVLALFTLALLFSAFWVGSALAKSMMVPVQRLAEATLAVAAGRLDVQVEGDAPDEIGVLVRSFNRMVEELRIGRARVERSTLDLQQSNTELDGRRRYIETVLENSPTGVISFDRDGRITNINRSAMQMFGFVDRPADLAYYRDVFAAKEFLELRILVEKVMGIRDISLVREIRLRLERRTVDLAVSFTALRDAQEHYIGLILVLEDISNLIKAQKVAAWREVARRIAHEIKNPLTPIQLSAQRILKKWQGQDPEVGRVIEECTGTIIQYVDGLKTLVNEFSRFARMPPVQPVPTELDKIIHNALVLYEGLHPGLRIERHVAPDLPTLNLDPEQIKRVLINLVDNAIQAQDGNGGIVIRARHDTRSQSVRIEVADDGPGIPAEDRDKLFVPYFSTRPGGTGLGLAIVHRVVSDHGGSIRVEENLPRGTRFVIDLPA